MDVSCFQHAIVREEWLMMDYADLEAVFNPQQCILNQKRHPYTGNLNSEMLGDSKNAFLHWGDVSGKAQTRRGCTDAYTT